MKKIILTVVAFVVLIAAAPISTQTINAANSNPFKDINNHWAKDTILQAYDKGLVDGFPDGTFRPNDVVKADQFIVMMLRAFSANVDGYTVFDPEWYEFLSDFQPGHLGTIRSAVRKNQFDFQTAKKGYWAKPYVDMLYEMPYLLEYDSVFPKDYKRFEKQIKREEASYLLGEWYSHFEGGIEGNYDSFVNKNSGLKDFNTFTDIVGKYKAMVLTTGLMNGYPNKYFYPHRYVTRAEALTMVLRLRDSSLRTPFKPNLKGQYYTEINGYIALFSDKYKFDIYNELVALGKKHIKKGYLDIKNSYSMAVFASKDDAESWDYYTRTGMWHLRPQVEMTAGVDSNDSRRVNVAYSRDNKLIYSEDYFNAVLELFAGKGKGAELKKVMQSKEKDLTSHPLTFTFNKKDFSIYLEGSLIVLHMAY
ncbi:S-layer homology domain-containing protein [Paenibacillus sp. IITD108]|uniref:S-layer homology domain-containing protein n=1 Tax=Paenibacillus sp. IITD108 TaxID=3116649 RepID=UPI002F42947D